MERRRTMPAADILQAGLVEGVMEMARSRLDPARIAIAEHLADAYLSAFRGSDLDGADPAMVYGAVVGLLGFMRDRQPGQAKVRIYDPDLERHGWSSPHSVIEIVNDDMPFLVDSVAMELARLGVTVHRLIHPVLAVRRDPNGRLEAIARPAGASPDSRPESVMHIEIDRQPPTTHASLAGVISDVLADVRRAVADWQQMRARIKQVAEEVAELATEEALEVTAFLDWLHADHFTFLGTRSFGFVAEGVGAGRVEVEADSELGLLADQTMRVFDDFMPLAAMPPEVRAFVRRPNLLLVTKSARSSRIHRPVHMDVIGVKRIGPDGAVTGLHTFLGLFTAAAYTRNPAGIPLLRTKVAQVRDRAGFPPFGHDAKALANILETFPRDELFQISEEALYRIALGILRLQERPRAALFVRKDEFERFVSCLVFLPRDRYDTPLRLAVQRILEQAFAGTVDGYYTQVADAPLARLHIVIRTQPGRIPLVDERDLEARIAEAARSWSDHLQDALIQAEGEAEGLRLARRYREAFPVGYRENHPVALAVADIGRIEAVLAGDDIALTLYRPAEAGEGEARLKLVHKGRPVPLSDILPILEAMGLRVIAELPHEVRILDEPEAVWLHDFQLESASGRPIDLDARGDAFEQALAKVWQGDAESDGFNRLVLSAGLDWRQVTVLRAYARYLRQAGLAFSQAYVERALADNPEVAGALVRLFEARFDPDGAGAGDDASAVLALLDAVQKADDDRILRRLLNAVLSTLRTNYFQPDRGYVAVKLDSAALDDLPLPRPMVEIFVYSPRVEAVHLRGGKVARGGIRWSDRPEDFRTEILGLMKAQMVKNAVIVPVGAKGGFVVKNPPPDRTRLQAEAIECYRIMMRGLLDLTDNLVAGKVVPPARLVRHDGDDPYLVVAADKGTASFSDIANAIALDYGFWLGDAFASGGSRGYDHKAMGITARGAWEAVKRHFRELGRNIQAEDFTVVGVGDMSGDVFGNAMLLSPHIRLVGAFNHSHIFVDPDPDPAVSLAERRRLFDAAKSWPDYDPAALSAGGGVFTRAAKTLPVSPQVAKRFGIETETVTPNQLIRILLKAPVDLLFFGGIGTYVKASGEAPADVGDRANDALRIDAAELAAKVVGEGANLAMTQLARVEYALAGGRLNTDAIDNSAGVDTSDHEVNIKILLGRLVQAGDLTEKQRDELLVEMTAEVADLVLRDNYLQTQALSVIEATGAAELLDVQGRFMRTLEKAGRLNRAVEFLPDDEQLTERSARRKGLTRPELAILLAYAKIWLHDGVLPSGLPDDPFLAADLARYFPTPLRDRFGAEIARHPLAREIVATTITNSIINRVGIAFVADMMEKTGHGPADVARAYIVARDAFRLREVWQRIEALDGLVPAQIQVSMLTEANRLLDRATAWVLRCVPVPFDIGAAIAELGPGVTALEAAVPGILPDDVAETVDARARDYAGAGVPEETARRVANLIVLASAADIVRIAARHGLTIEEAGRLYFVVGTRFGLGWLRLSAQRLGTRGHWQKLAAAAAIEELYAHQRDIATAVAAEAPGLAAPEALDAWVAAHRPAVDSIDALIGELKAAPHIELAMLTVVNQKLRSLGQGGAG
ncbi:MAG: NAD-glutamate dehydrogenase [Solirubrobacterales bacterium]